MKTQTHCSPSKVIVHLVTDKTINIIPKTITEIVNKIFFFNITMLLWKQRGNIKGENCYLKIANEKKSEYHFLQSFNH